MIKTKVNVINSNSCLKELSKTLVPLRPRRWGVVANIYEHIFQSNDIKGNVRKSLIAPRKRTESRYTHITERRSVSKSFHIIDQAHDATAMQSILFKKLNI